MNNKLEEIKKIKDYRDRFSMLDYDLLYEIIENYTNLDINTMEEVMTFFEYDKSCDFILEQCCLNHNPCEYEIQDNEIIFGLYCYVEGEDVEKTYNVYA